MLHNVHLIAALSVAVLLMFALVPTQLRVGNVAILALVFGTFLVTLTYLINILIWDGNTRNFAPVWCDISALCSLSIDWFVVFTTHSVDFSIILYHTGAERSVVHLYTSRVDLIAPQRRLKSKSPQAFRNRALLCSTAYQHTYPYVFAN
jgi:pheromone a factor receptor